MKQKFSFKHCISVLLVAVIVLVGFVAVKPVAAADEEVKADNCTEYASEYYDGEKYAGYRASVTDEEGNVSYPNYPTKDGYVFAGWYQGTEEGTAIDLEKPLGATAANSAEGAWAKFVPDEVLSVKAQISANLISSDANADKSYADIRFITTVDNLKYSQIGFDFSINGGNVITRASNKVYTQLRAVGETEGDIITYSPSSQFCGLSKYFKTWTFTNVPEASFDAQFSVTPFWVTLDGTKVCGELAIRTVNQGLAQSDLRPFEAEYDYEYYETLEGAIEAANDETNGKSEAVITLLDDVEIKDTIAIGGEGLTKCTNITITNFVDVANEDKDEDGVKDGKVEYSITKSSDFTGTNMFSVASGYALTIEGADSSSKAGITVDGNSVDTGATLIVNKGTLVVKNATVANALVNASETATKNVTGGAINSTGTGLTVENCSFENNASDNNGGAILVSGTTNSISNTTFTGNRSRFNCGGALSCGGGTTTVTSCVFDGNWVGTADGTNAAGKNGGAVYVNNGNASVEIIKSEFQNNHAKDGGAIRVTASKLLTISECNFKNNKSIYYGTNGEGYGGAINISAGTSTINNTTFSANTAENGAGALAFTGGTLTLSGSTFTENIAGVKSAEGSQLCAGMGGAIYTNGGTFAAGSDNNTFTRNEANKGGAIYYTSTSTLAPSKWKFEGNYVVNRTVGDATSATNGAGGAIYQNKGTMTFANDSTFVGNYGRDGGALYSTGSASVSNFKGTLFEGNYTTGNCGGAIYLIGGATLNTSENCIFKANAGSETKEKYESGTYNKNAGAIYVTGADATNANLEDTIFEENRGQQGAAVLVNRGSLDIVGCEFKNNQATGQKGGAIYVAKSTNSPTVNLNGTEEKPNIFSGNTVYAGTQNEDLGVNADVATINMSYCEFVGDGRVVLYMSGTSVATANVSGEVNGATFVYSGSTSAITKGVTVTEAGVTGDITIVPHVNTEGTAVLFGTITDSVLTCVDSIATADGKHFAIDSDGKLAYASVAEVGSVAYDTFAEAVAAVTTDNSVITLVRDAEVYSKITVSGNLTIQSESGKDVALYRGTGLSKNDMFNVPSGATLTIDGVNGGYVTLDGRTATDAGNGKVVPTTASSGRLIMNASGTTRISNANLQYAYCTNGAGGAIDCSNGTVNVQNSNFTANNAYKEGAAIRVCNTSELYVANCNFINNASSYGGTQGGNGAIYATGSANATIDVTDDGEYVFNGNTAYRGNDGYIYGAIATNSGGVVRYSAKYIFENNTHVNKADLGAGVGVHSAGKTLIRMDEANSYEALVKAVKNAVTTHQTEITLLNDIAIGDTRIDVVTSGNDVVITNASGTPVKITRGSSKNSNLFAVGEGSTLSFVANTENDGSLTIDGTCDTTKSAMLYVKDGGTLVLNGITVTGGAAGDGAAIKVVEGTADIDNCTFTGNTAANGGAISLNSSNGEVSCTVDNTVFNANTASASGGALYIGSTNKVTCAINGSTFTGNTATSNGGAIFTENSNEESSLTIEGTTFGSETDGNTAKNGGAIYQAKGTTYLLGTVNFIGNSATNGGAIYVAAGTLTTQSTDVTIASGVVNFTSNTIVAPSTKSTYGGAIYQGGGTISLLGGGKFENNTAGVVTVNLCAAGAVNVASGTFNVSGYEFTGNSAVKDGGALRVDAGTANVTNCNFTNNSAGTTAEVTGNGIYNGRGGAIYISGGGKGVLNLLGAGTFEGNTYTYGSTGTVKNAIYNSAGTMTGTELYTFNDNTVEP